MRRVGVRGSLLAGMSAAAILAFVVRPVAAEDTAALSPDVTPAGDDYYTQRAKRTLEAEKRATVEPHPLAAHYPGMDIVVCEAGCTAGRGAQVVAARKRDDQIVKSEGFMVATSANAADLAPATGAAACIAGCYTAADDRPVRRVVTPEVKRMALPPRDKLSPIR